MSILISREEQRSLNLAVLKNRSLWRRTWIQVNMLKNKKRKRMKMKTRTSKQIRA